MRKVALIIAAGSIVVLLAATPPFVLRLSHLAKSSGRLSCPANLSRIGTAIALYAADHGGTYPDNFRTLLLAQSDSLSPAVFICDGIATTPASSVAAFTGSVSDCDYVYVGVRLSADATSDVVVAFDRTSNHDLDGVNVLFGDGHVDFVLWPGRKPPPSWMQIQDQITRDLRPIRVSGATTTAVR